MALERYKSAMPGIKVTFLQYLNICVLKEKNLNFTSLIFVYVFINELTQNEPLRIIYQCS